MLSIFNGSTPKGLISCSNLTSPADSSDALRTFSAKIDQTYLILMVASVGKSCIIVLKYMQITKNILNGISNHYISHQIFTSYCFMTYDLTIFCVRPDITLTHWGRVTHIWVGKLTIIASDNGLSPSWHQTIIWTNAGILLIGPLGTNFSEILIEIHSFSFKKMHLKMSSARRRPFCLSLNELR